MKTFLLFAMLIASAQSAWTQQSKVREGSTVRLHLRDSSVLYARIMGIRADSVAVRLRIDAPVTSIPRSDISALEIRVPSEQRGRSAARGALIGAAAGSALGTALAIAAHSIDCADCERANTGQTVLYIGVVSAASAALGTLAGWLFAPGQWKAGVFE